MSVVGVDLGSLNTVIAVARNRGVDVVSTPLFLCLLPLYQLSGLYVVRTLLTFLQITNEVSNRATP